MANLFLITNKKFDLDGYNVKYALVQYEGLYNDILNFEPEIVILDEEIENSKLILMTIASKNINNEFDIFYLSENPDLKSAETFAKVIKAPVNNDILLNEIKFSMKNRKTINELHKENLELKKNLYQIDAFYNASSKFAGTLDKEKLYEVTFESLEKILSFDAVCALFHDNLEDDKLKFYITSLKKTTKELNENLIKRLYLSAKEEGIKSFKTAINNVETTQNVKHSYKNEYFDLAKTEYDSLISPVIIKNKFEGIIEVYRKNKFTKEDVTCFQSIIHQLQAPLRSAVLYEEMINTNEKLKKLEKMKSEFVSIVSHELRTPLTPINNALSIILSEQGGKIGDTNKNFANIAKRNVSRLSGIIEDLLDLSRMQTGKFEFKFKKTSISPSLELAYNTFKNQAASKNIVFKLESEENLPDVYIDTHRIDQILSNLITNALKFTPEGGKISIEAGLAENPKREEFISPPKDDFKGKYLKISVKDTGVGIDENDIPKIFDKFSQIENTLQRNTGGIGLGLTITKHFIDSHLGGIKVNSKKNKGADFEVFIPLYSDIKAFQIEFNLKKQAGKETIAYFKIKENNQTPEFFNRLKNTNVIKLTKNSKEISYKENNNQVSEVFIPSLNVEAYNFMVSKIEEDIISNKKDCDIVLSKAFIKNNGF